MKLMKNVLRALEDAQLNNFMRLSGINTDFIIEEDEKICQQDRSKECVFQELFTEILQY